LAFAAVVAVVAEALRAEEAVVAEPALPLEAAPAGQLLVRRRGQVRAALLQ
jgi:hypothetical protein